MWESELKEDKAVQDEAQHEEEAAEAVEDADDDDDDDDDGFGDEFDEFAEGGGDDDFGDFDEAEEVMTPKPTIQSAPEPQHTTSIGSILAGLVSSISNEIHAPITPN